MLPGGYNLIAVANLRVEETDPKAAWLGQAHQLLLHVLPSAPMVSGISCGTDFGISL